MEFEQIKVVVAESLPLRPPRFEPGTSASEKVSALEDYLLASAYQQAELEEALYWLDSMVEHFKAKIEQMTGWEAALPSKSRDRITRDDILLAKRRTDPVTFDAGSEARQLRATTLRQIERFRFEAGQGPVSRAYTLISGG